MAKAYCQNLDKPPLHVRHSELKRWCAERSHFRSECPVCPDGLLMVGRESGTLNLLRYDNCITCGQRVVYLDLDIAGELLYPIPIQN